MPTVRCEIREFGVADSLDGSIVPTIRKMGVSAELTPTSSSQIAVGGVSQVTNVVVKAIGAAIYARSGAYVASPEAPVAGPAPAPGEYIVAGGYAIIELAIGEALAVRLANLS